ncbi:MAG TPA: ferritin family protein [bacterium]|nr:ferritin family protein [bacterium]HPN33192.1 ferritin family protein [bacterium]
MPEEKNIQELGSMKDILQGAIQREESSYRFYLEAKARSRTPTEAALFEALANEELAHKQKLTSQLEAILAQIEIDRALSYDVY